MLRWLRIVLGVVLFVLLLVIGTFQLNESDTMQYLLDGKILFSQGFHADFCSFNYIPGCLPAYTNEWLANFAMYFPYAMGSLKGSVKVLETRMAKLVFPVLFLA